MKKRVQRPPHVKKRGQWRNHVKYRYLGFVVMCMSILLVRNINVTKSISFPDAKLSSPFPFSHLCYFVSSCKLWLCQTKEFLVTKSCKSVLKSSLSIRNTSVNDFDVLKRRFRKNHIGWSKSNISNNQKIPNLKR